MRHTPTPWGGDNGNLEPFQTLPCVSLPLAGSDFLFTITSIIAECFQWVLWANLVNYQTSGISENPQIYNQLVRCEGGLETPKLVASVWSEGSIAVDYALWNLAQLQVAGIGSQCKY